MSVLVCESILGEYTRLLFYVGYTIQRKYERDNATQAYLQRRCVRTHGHAVSELRVWSGNGNGINGNVSLSME